MKLKKIIPISGVLLASSDIHGFTTPRLINHLPKSIHTMHSHADDDDLFTDLYNQKNNHTLSDDAIYAELREYSNQVSKNISKVDNPPLPSLESPVDAIMSVLNQFNLEELLKKISDKENKDKFKKLNNKIITKLFRTIFLLKLKINTPKIYYKMITQNEDIMKLKQLYSLLSIAITSSSSQSDAFTFRKPIKPLQKSTTSIKSQNKNDDILFEKLYREKNKHTLSDNTIHSGLKNYQNTKKEFHSELVADQKDLLNDLSSKISQFERIKNISKLLTNLRGDKEINLSDDNINPTIRKDSLIFQDTTDNKVAYKNTIYINDNFISEFMNVKQLDGDNPLLANIPIKERVYNMFKKTKFDPKFSSHNTFLQQDSQSKYPMTGGILRGTYRGKEVYFLLTKTLDKQFRLINISDTLDDLKTTQYLK